jgi:peptide/nickel transport system permease protein
VRLLAAFALVVLVAPLLAPYDPGRLFDGYAFAPPMFPRVVDDGRIRAPFAYPLVPVDPIERRYDADRSRRVHSFSEDTPWFLLGSDPLGRDVLSRLMFGARLSLGIALLATCGALAIGGAIGALAAYAGGWIDGVLMRLADFVIVLPAIYLVLALRGALPVELTTSQVFVALVGVLTLIGWPTVARGVRGILVVERQAEYAEAARAMGAGSARVILRHLLPAASGFFAVQATLLVPAFITAEVTLSIVGLGFMPPAASWGVMLRDALSPGTLVAAPWLLAPAGAVVLTVLTVHLAATRRTKLRSVEIRSQVL